MAIPLGIIEIRNIIKTIRENYGDDFSNYAMTSFRRRLSAFIDKKKISHISELLEMLRSVSLYEEFLYNLAVEDTEMFRDPGMWQILKTKVLPELCKNQCTIWMAGSNSGEELYSLLILLYENNLMDRTHVICSNFSQKAVDQIANGEISTKKIEPSQANYKRFGGLHSFDDYFTIKSKQHIFQKDLLAHVNFKILSLMRDNLPETDLLIYRNQMLYFNRVLQHQVLENLHGSVNHGGYLVIGNKESIESFNIYNYFTAAYKAEGIYKKPLH